MTRGAKFFTLTTTALGLLVLLAAGALVAGKWFRETGLIEALHSRDEAVRRDAAAKLAAMGSPRSARALADLVERDCRDHGEFDFLYQGGGVPVPRQSYIAIPGHGISYFEVHYAALALEAMGSPAVPELARLIAHEDSYIRLQASVMMVRLGPRAREGVDSLIAVVADHGSESYFDDWAQLTAALALANMGCQARRAVPALQNVHSRTETETGVFSSLADWILLDCGEGSRLSEAEIQRAADFIKKMREFGF